MDYFCSIASPVGVLTVSSDGEHLTGLWIDKQKYHGGKEGNKTQAENLPVFDRIQQWLDCYFSGKNPGFNLPLAPSGSAFRQTVWQRLCEIPYGEVTTYGAIAKEIGAKTGQKMSAQAVGGAVGHNPISIVIPCHRVVGANGNLTGYAGGLDKKISLLTLEGLDMSQFYVPKKGTAL